jgi:hypothetical protein
MPVLQDRLSADAGGVEELKDKTVEFLRSRQADGQAIVENEVDSWEVSAAEYVHEFSPAIMVLLAGSASPHTTSNNTFWCKMIQMTPAQMRPSRIVLWWRLRSMEEACPS